MEGARAESGTPSYLMRHFLRTRFTASTSTLAHDCLVFSLSKCCSATTRASFRGCASRHLPRSATTTISKPQARIRALRHDRLQRATTTSNHALTHHGSRYPHIDWPVVDFLSSACRPRRADGTVDGACHRTTTLSLQQHGHTYIPTYITSPRFDF